jgi:hypothetical protein
LELKSELGAQLSLLQI